MPLAPDLGHASLPLGIQGVERLIEPLGVGLAGVDSTSHPALAQRIPRIRPRPKKRGPDQWAPVIFLATRVRL